MKTVQTDKAPAAIGAYAQAVVHGDTVYCSGQIPLTPDGAMVEGDVAAQARQCLDNLAAVLLAADSALDRALQVTIYLVDMDDFTAVNEVYAAALGTHRPARATVAVVGLPRGARVEIACTAAR